MNRLARWNLARAGITGAYRSDRVVFSRDNKLLCGLRVADIVREFRRKRWPRMHSGRYRHPIVLGRREVF